jgi:NOL1/NOP2/sun family putative RNA methylase
LGYYYIQEIASMMPVLVLNPKSNESVLDLAAAPGSKTTQIACMMNNQGVLIANEVSLGRVSILSTNLQRCAVTNSLVIRQTGESLCKKLVDLDFKLDKILADVPCSGEGTIRSSPKTTQMFSENLINNLSNTQKYLAINALKALKVNGTLVYSTCTHAPEENEAIISHLLENYPVEIQEIILPLKTRPGITKWKNEVYNKDVKKCARIYPQDNNTEGFFIAYLKKTGEIK